MAINYFFYQKYLHRLLQKAVKESDTTLTHKDLRRMRFFSIFIPVMLGYGFGLLRQKKMNRKERRLMMNFSAATPIFDDFFDDKNLQVNHLQMIFSAQENYQPQNSKEKIFQKILFATQPKIVFTQKILNQCMQVFIAQQAAQQQTLAITLPKEKLRTISFAKCSQSTILFWSLLHEQYTDAEKAVIIQQGHLIQLTDDVFDLWFDIQEGIQTLATNTHSVVELENDFYHEWNQLKKAVAALPIAQRYKTQFLSLQWFFFSRALVALEQLKKLELPNKKFMPANFTRRQLVCDMEKWSNRIKWVKYFAGKNYK